MVTVLAALPHAVMRPSRSKMRSGDSGRFAKRTPVASATAFAIAGATGLIAHSPWALAPSGPIVSYVSAKYTSLWGTSAKAGNAVVRAAPDSPWRPCAS